MNERARALGNRRETLDEAAANDPLLRVSGVQARAERVRTSAPPQATRLFDRTLVSIGAPADASLLEPTYAYLSAYAARCLPPQVAQRLNVAMYELYGNALRYGSSASEVRLELQLLERGVRLVVRNHADLAALERLSAQVVRVNADPDAAFSSEMSRFAGTTSQPAPMIGLVRVAYEAGLKIEARIQGQQVEVSTTCEG